MPPSTLSTLPKMSGGTQHSQPCNLVVVREAYVVALEGETLMLSADDRCFTRRFPPQFRQRDVDLLNVNDHLNFCPLPERCGFTPNDNAEDAPHNIGGVRTAADIQQSQQGGSDKAGRPTVVAQRR